MARVTVRDRPPSGIDAATGPGTEVDDEAARTFRELALPWMRAGRRDLPWRRTRDPWEVHVAECMLQQTQVARVIPKWHGFLDRFPTVADCAGAPVSETIRLWEGLGYNRRAVLLHRCAVRVVADFAGIFPADVGKLMSLPGVGPYTARAVMAFAFELDVAVLDTNVARIVARCVAGRSLRLPEAQNLADALVPDGSGWEWNQGMLDLGATVCTKRAPRCGGCPVRNACRWRMLGADTPDPAEGSAGVTVGQTRFEGSDRQLRGKLVDALRRSPVAVSDADRVTASSDPGRTRRIIRALIDDGLAVEADGVLTLGV